MISSDFKLFQMISNGFNWVQLNSSEFKWAPPLPPILLSNFSWLYRYRFHWDSLDLTWTHLISLGSPWPHLSQGKGNTWSHKGKGKESLPWPKGKRGMEKNHFWDPFWPYIQLRTHARTKRNDFPVGLSLPTSEQVIYNIRTIKLSSFGAAGWGTRIWSLGCWKKRVHFCNLVT